MSSIDLSVLLQPCSDSEPSGEDPEYDSAFMEMEQAAQGKPEQQYGDTVIPAEEPDWKQVKRLSLELMGRCKDLRVAVYFAKAALATDGLSEFAEAIGLLCGYVEKFWDTVHPQLDPDDDNDPTIRVNTIGSLNDAGTTLRMIRQCPIVESRMVGRFSLRDIRIAKGDIAPPPDMDNKPEMAAIEAAFMDCDLEQLRGRRASVEKALSQVRDIVGAVTSEVGAMDTVNLKDLETALREVLKVIDEHLAKRGSGEAEETEEAGADAATAAPVGGDGAKAGAAAPKQRLTGEITTREDVIRALDKICQYYDRYEPSSPLPLLLKRAKRLATMSFIEILRDLTPEGLSQAVAIGGITEDDLARHHSGSGGDTASDKGEAASLPNMDDF